MPQPATKGWFIVFLIILLLLSTTLAFAQEPVELKAADRANETTEAPNTAGAMVLDAFLLRPLGFVATVLGSATFVVTLPFSLPTRSADEAAKVLVVNPAKYTFARPLGEVGP